MVVLIMIVMGSLFWAVQAFAAEAWEWEWRTGVQTGVWWLLFGLWMLLSVPLLVLGVLVATFHK